MADPLSIALGVLPICLSALQGLSVLRAKIKLLRQYGRHVSSFRNRLDAQSGYFEDEVQFILREVVEAKTAWSMMGDKAQAKWTAPDIEILLEKHFGNRYQRFKVAVQEVVTTTQQLDLELARFSAPDEQIPWCASAKERLRLTFKIKDYEEHIGKLKEAIGAIRRLRKNTARLRAFEEARPRPPPPVIKEGTRELQDFRAIRTAASHLHAVLHDITPSCDNTVHSRHLVKLLLPYAESRQRARERTTRFALLLEYAGQDGKMSFSNRLPFQVSCVETVDEHVTQRRRLDPSPDVPMDSLCRQLTAICIHGNHALPSPPSQLGSLGKFHIEALPDHMRNLTSHPAHQDTALVDLLHRPVPVHDILSDRDRLELAISLVKATLRHWGTPWWPMGCLLSDIKVLGGAADSLGTRLKSLHVTAAMLKGMADDLPSRERDPSDDDMKHARENFGVRNLDLYRLGVALLQIGLWDLVPWKDPALVRRKTDRLSFCGKKYQQATERLIECDFGETRNLDDEGLQRAVCTRVVVDLESLMRMAHRAEPRTGG